MTFQNMLYSQKIKFISRIAKKVEQILYLSHLMSMKNDNRK